MREVILKPERRFQPQVGILFYLLCVFMLGWALIVAWMASRLPVDSAAMEAARVQTLVIQAVAAGAIDRGIAIDTRYDLNQTGLIGEAHTGLTSTMGNLPAKRTAASPDAAALLVRLLRDAGAGRGTLVAVNASGSFPGFALAAVAACGALGADAVIVLSLGSSSWGANRPDYTIFDMFLAARKNKAFPDGYQFNIAAISPGGAKDQGLDLDPLTLETVLARVESYGVPVIRPVSLDDAVAARRFWYESQGKPDILLSLGSNYASAGANPDYANRSGLILPDRSAKLEGEGLIPDFLRAGKPVIQILDVADLSAKFGVPFDPHPFDPPGRARVYRLRDLNIFLLWLPVLMAWGLYLFLRRKKGWR